MVKPHSEPWIARLVISDLTLFKSIITKMSEEFESHKMNQSEDEIAKLLERYDSKISTFKKAKGLPKVRKRQKQNRKPEPNPTPNPKR